MQSETNEIPGYIEIHNKSLYNDFVSSLIYNDSTSDFTVHETSKQCARHTKSSSHSHNNNTVSAVIKAKKLESKKKKILKYHAELEQWRENDVKRTQQMIEFKKTKDESEFRNRLNMIANRGGIYGEISEVLYKHKSQNSAKTTNLYSNWCRQVYQPINKRIKTTANDEQFMINKKNKIRNLYDKYLTECNKNGNKIFLDSINAQEYDPFEWQSKDHKSHKNTVPIHDPLKSDLYKYITEQKISNKTNKYFSYNTKDNTVTNPKNSSKSNSFSLKAHTRFCVSPVQYNQVSHLPLFRDMATLERNKSKCILPSHLPGGDVLLNQFEVPKYNPEIVKKQFFPQTKRIVKPAFAKYEFKISEMW